ncbi:MAG: AraC family transcriptional regulator [Bacteroidia bacterium]|nr:AraC family transcriptional regulator [Bacteroidia bacterium]
MSSLPLIPANGISTLVEQRRGLSLDQGQLNIYETRKETRDFPLSFEGFTITSMILGKKKIRFGDEIKREYLPGNTVIAPSYSRLSIDFPEASFETPTQCTALTLENSYVQNQIYQFNEALTEESLIGSWRILKHPILLNNNQDLVAIHHKIMKLAASNTPFKELHIQLLMKEIVLCVLKLQNLKRLMKQASQNANDSAFSAIIHFIKRNIFNEIQVEDLLRISNMSKSAFYRAFVDELGVSPYQLVINERLNFAKKLLLGEKLSVKETAYASGFSSPNYFIRLFKKHEGMTPRMFVKLNC